MKYKTIVIGVSTGGMTALTAILPELTQDLPFAVIVVIHRAPDSDDYLERSLDEKCNFRVKQADDKEKIEPGTVYFAPPNYHLLVEDDFTFSLSVDRHVNFARPSIDVLFESAADVYGPKLVGVILTGANADGSKGLMEIKKMGGLTVVQDPESAEMASMPQAAIERARPDHILAIDKVAPFFKNIIEANTPQRSKT